MVEGSGPANGIWGGAVIDVASGLSGLEIPESEPGMAVVHQLRAVTVELNLMAAEFAGANGLHVTDLRALIELLDAERDGVVAAPGWLGERLRLGSPSATALVDRLERLGHVRRTRDEADRRRVL